MASLELKKLVKEFGSGTTLTRVIHGVDLKVENGEFVVFVGPSGCGKSTLLRLICGLEDATSGDLLLDDPEKYNQPKAPTLPQRTGLPASIAGAITSLILGLGALMAFRNRGANEKNDKVEARKR